MSEASLIPNARWNYEPVDARVCRVRVGRSVRPTWWCAGLEGSEREAVEVSYGGEKFYLDNGPNPDTGQIDESGIGKVTGGRGGPDYGHRSLPVSEVIEYLSFDDTFGKRRREFLAKKDRP